MALDVSRLRISIYALFTVAWYCVQPRSWCDWEATTNHLHPHHTLGVWKACALLSSSIQVPCIPQQQPTHRVGEVRYDMTSIAAMREAKADKPVTHTHTHMTQQQHQHTLFDYSARTWTNESCFSNSSSRSPRAQPTTCLELPARRWLSIVYVYTSLFVVASDSLRSAQCAHEFRVTTHNSCLLPGYAVRYALVYVRGAAQVRSTTTIIIIIKHEHCTIYYIATSSPTSRAGATNIFDPEHTRTHKLAHALWFDTSVITLVSVRCPVSFVSPNGWKWVHVLMVTTMLADLMAFDYMPLTRERFNTHRQKPYIFI